MSEQWGDCLTLLDERDGQEEVTLIMTPLSTPILPGSTHKEEDEKEAEEDTASDVATAPEVPPETQRSVSIPKTQGDAQPGTSTTPDGSQGHASEPQTPAHIGAEHVQDFCRRQQCSRKSMMKALVESAQTQVAATDDWWHGVWDVLYWWMVTRRIKAWTTP
ncbi:hypothetical protein Y1Q_0013284 [Alligator mississippiensis]|uniref:Uncharacterized protein n=1 Tax=Alligator mississippiensis TaxID=8496 RepID=A0A151MH25_ALLMI|nr:hypothetical protein Y1Q_0013284 [Alligator mississippiensis]